MYTIRSEFENNETAPATDEDDDVEAEETAESAIRDASTSRVGRPSPPSVLRISASSALKDDSDADSDGVSDDADEANVEVVGEAAVGGAEMDEDADAAAAGST